MASQPHSGTASGPRKIPARFLAVGVALLVLIALGVIFLLSGETGDQRTIAERSTDADKAAPATETSSTGVLQAGDVRLLPIPQGALKDAVGKDVRGRAVPVQSSSPKQGFWVGNSDAQRVYVSYSGKSATAIGRRVDLQGTVRELPDNPTKALGLRHDDLQQVRMQGGYIEAKMVKQVGKPIGTVPKGP